MEIWKPVAINTAYEVSDLGRIRRIGASKCLTPGVTHGYEFVTLSAGGIHPQRRLHVLVCEAFHGQKPTTRHQAAHNDGNKRNNVPTNLRWATPAENAFDKREHGTHLDGSKVFGAVLVESDIAPIRYLISQHVPLAVIGEAYGVTKENIAHLRDGNTWTQVPGVGRTTEQDAA